MGDWREAWERDKHNVGRAVHEAWAGEKVRQGFAAHALVLWESPRWKAEMLDKPCAACDLPREKHHPDMLHYDDLAPNIQAYDIETGIVGFRMGYEAAKREAQS